MVIYQPCSPHLSCSTLFLPRSRSERLCLKLESAHADITFTSSAALGRWDGSSDRQAM